jgi:hypothetical protein
MVTLVLAEPTVGWFAFGRPHSIAGNCVRPLSKSCSLMF